jgi:RNA polymerase sigma-70 factor (ECF subfamily)
MAGAPVAAEKGRAEGLSPSFSPATPDTPEDTRYDVPCDVPHDVRYIVPSNVPSNMSLMGPREIIEQEPASDDALMSRVREGDVQALGPLYDRHHAALLNFYLRTLGNRAGSEDLVQDVFVRMLKYRRTYRPGSRFRTWMYHIARHARTDYLHKRRGEIEWDDAYASPVLPGDPAESGQHQRWLALALQRLPDEKREILVLSCFSGMRYEEIGRLLDCGEGAVKVRVHRAMRELRDCFHQIAHGHIARGQNAREQTTRKDKP